jgi:hypothetical protein
MQAGYSNLLRHGLIMVEELRQIRMMIEGLP